MNRRIFGLGLGSAATATATATAMAQTQNPAPARPATVPETSPLILANPDLSKFRPMKRILFYDDFDKGVNGWAELQANHNGNLDDLRPVLSDMRPAQLSSCTFFDLGTHGSMNGTYSLKLATRPKPFHTAVGIKRLTYSQPCKMQFEMWFTYKAEQTFDGSPDWDGNASPAEANFGDFTLSIDICAGVGGPRYMHAVRYQNTGLDGKMAQKWMYKTSLHTTTKMDRQGKASQNMDYHVQKVTDWVDVPGGHQPLCFNELPTKVNWHYLRWVLDLKERKNVELQVNDVTMDLRKIPVLTYDQEYHAINHLLNILVDVRTHKAVRNFFYIDSILFSTEV